MQSIRSLRRLTLTLLLINVPVGMGGAWLAGVPLEEWTLAQAEWLNRALLVFGWGEPIAVTVAGLAFLTWYHRAHRNLKREGAFPEGSSEGNVFWFFVPIVNFVYPLLAMRSLLKATVSVCRNSPPTIGSSHIAIWYAGYIVIWGFNRAAQEPDLSMEATATIGAMQSLASMLGALLTWRVVRALSNSLETHVEPDA